MASLLVLTAITLLLASCNAVPRRFIDIKIPPECQRNENSTLDSWKDFCFVKPEGYEEIERNVKDLLPPYMENVNNKRDHEMSVIMPSDATFSPYYEERDNCPYKATWESVYFYKNETTSKLDIIVQTKFFPQKLLKVQCKSGNEGPGVMGKCFTRLGYDNFEKKFLCQESKIKRSLIVYDPETHSLKSVSYEVPVTCSCRVVNL